MDSLATPKTLIDQVYEVILDAICAGELKPGERLAQHQVAQRLNVSRQPIQNALLILKAQGFVRETGRRGLVVAPLDPALFEAIYQFRSALEPLAVRLAIPRLRPETVARGRTLIQQGRSASDSSNSRALVEADMAFHSYLYELSGNSLILETMRLNWQHLRRAMGEVLRVPALSRRVWQEHETILKAMIAGETDCAADLIRDHVLLAYQDVSAALPQRPDISRPASDIRDSGARAGRRHRRL